MTKYTLCLKKKKYVWVHDQGLYLKLTEGLADQEVIFYLDLEYSQWFMKIFTLVLRGFYFLFVFWVLVVKAWEFY